MSDSTPTPSGTKGKAFKPRAGIVRKSKAEREAHAKQEEEKAAARAAAAAQAVGKSTQPTKSSASKKKELQRESRDDSQGVAGGVFGAGTGTRQAWKRSVIDGGSSEMLEGQEVVKPSAGPSLQGQDGDGTGQRKTGGGSGAGPSGPGAGIGGRSSRIRRDGLAFESDDEPEEERRDIERIQISSDEDATQEEIDEDVVLSGKGKARALSAGGKTKQSGGLRPVRAPRHREEDLDLETEKKGDKKLVKSGRTVIDDADGRDDGNEMEVDEEPAGVSSNVKQDVPSSPEISRRGKPGKRIGVRTRDNKHAAETVEERAERVRLIEDTTKLREQFVTSPKIKRQDDTEMVEKDTQKPDNKLFLLQFPPLIPLLVDQAAVPSSGQDRKQQQSQASEPAIKSDPDAPPPVIPSTTENGSSSVPTIPKTQVDGMLTAAEPTRLPAGRVGKLKVHRSGKVTLDWGGTSMEVRYGTEVDFLQDAVLVQTPGQPGDGSDKDIETQTGTTYALGHVQKKMVIIPDWQKLYD